MSTLIIDCISDTHNKHKSLKLEGGDLLIHSGDATSRGEVWEIEEFLNWFQKQPYQYKVFVPGNHDWGFQRNPDKWRQECEIRGIVLLNDSGIVLEGVKIWGSPITPWFFDWAFNRRRGAEIKEHWDLIPSDTELLITHGPADKVLDVVINRYSNENGEHVGCEDLSRRIDELKDLKLHVFGHIHCAAGTQEVKHYTAINAATLGEDYKPNGRHATRLFRTVHDTGTQYTIAP